MENLAILVYGSSSSSTSSSFITHLNNHQNSNATKLAPHKAKTKTRPNSSSSSSSSSSSLSKIPSTTAATTTRTTTTTTSSSSSCSISTVRPSPSPLISTIHKHHNRHHQHHPKYYADLASKLAEDGRLEDFAIVVESVIGSGGGDVGNAEQFVAMLDVEVVAQGILRNLREGNVKCVVEVLSKVERLGVDPKKIFDDGFRFNLLKKECQWIVGCGYVEELVELMETLAGFHFTIKELVDPSAIIKICVDKCKPELSIRFACTLPNSEILFCNIIHEFGKKQDLVSALTAYEASKQNLKGPNMYVYRTIIDVCGLCSGYMKSRYIYEDLLKQNVVPNIYVFNSLMNVNAHDLSYTLDVYRNMQDIGVAADVATYNILLKACCLAGRVDLAQYIYNEVKHLESAGVLKLDVFTYCTIIKVFADAKLWQMALKIKEDMLTAGVTPNTATWSSLISACANAGLVEQAIHLFEEMLRAGCEPNSQCCNTLLHACVEACQYDRAFRLFRSWMGSSVQESSEGDYNSNTDSILTLPRRDKHFVTSLPNSLSYSQRLKLAKGFSFTPSTTSYNILMKACGTDYYRARALMDEMRTCGLSPNHISWSILIDLCGASANAEGAIQILRNMCAAAIKPDVVAYTTAIKVCVESKKLKLAFSLFAEMKRQQIQPNLVTYNTLLRARSRYGSLQEVQQCLAIYQDMRKAGYKSNDYYLKELIEEWCEGVIQDNNQTQGEFSYCKRSNLGRPWSLLLEKVAAHLQMSNAESLAVDLQGLTKVEARIVVLAVLRMIKENHALGHEVKDDILIIIGVYKEIADQAKHESEVKDAMVKLLQHELGLEVLVAGPRIKFNEKADLKSPFHADQNLEEILGKKKLPAELSSPTRRPAILQRLKITRKSLHNWLDRREGTTRR